jgi:hypothetical protein
MSKQKIETLEERKLKWKRMHTEIVDLLCADKNEMSDAERSMILQHIVNGLHLQ